MKGLSLIQPWAALVALGHKRVETRSWPTTIRGAIAIHAAKSFPPDCQRLCYDQPFSSALDCGPRQLPLGSIVAIATLVDCRPAHEVAGEVSPLELRFGDYTPGRYAWMLVGVVALKEPIPCKGALRFWTVPPAIARLLEEARA